MEHSRIDHSLDYKSSLGKFKKTEITSTTFSDHNSVRLEINERKNYYKSTNTWRVNNTLSTNQDTLKRGGRNKHTSDERQCKDDPTPARPAKAAKMVTAPQPHLEKKNLT